MRFNRVNARFLLVTALSLNLLACAVQQPEKEESHAPERADRMVAQEQKGAPPPQPLLSVAKRSAPAGAAVRDESPPVGQFVPETEGNTEAYDAIAENPFLEVIKNPLSTFSIDVDTASYSNMRRFVMQGKKPPIDAVRIEELVNYFPYDYPAPEGDAPFSVQADLADAPWNKQHKLLRVGLQGKKLDLKKAPANNLVFLLDVSGSMNDPNKLPLLKQSLRLLVNELREQDTIAIAVYAGAAGLVLPSTSAARKDLILDALDRLEAGGSTAGEAGIRLAYETAKQHFKPNGNNRVILATDGDFNVGPSSDGELVRLIEDKRKAGIFLTVLGFGMGNYKDAKMEKLADTGNGNYAYIDNLMEAKKVLVTQMGGTLHTIAKDVKLQLEFNPTKVASYRLMGYENRLLRSEDFDNDAKDAGELGSGHSVTALYELVPTQAGAATGQELTYQQTATKQSAHLTSDWLTLKLRYKQPQAETSQLLTRTVQDRGQTLAQMPADFRFAAAVAGFGMVLRNSPHRGDWTIPQSKALAEGALGRDPNGYRKEFLTLLSRAQSLD